MHARCSWYMYPRQCNKYVQCIEHLSMVSKDLMYRNDNDVYRRWNERFTTLVGWWITLCRCVKLDFGKLKSVTKWFQTLLECLWMSMIMGTPPQKFKKQMPQIATLKGVHDSSGVFLILFGDRIVLQSTFAPGCSIWGFCCFVACHETFL